MTDYEHNENELIAEFMGLKPQSNKDNRYFNCPDRYYKYHSDYWKISNTCTPENMKYHSSWDWLMPVVKKIESCNEVDEFRIIYDSVCHSPHSVSILPAYKNFPEIHTANHKVKIHAVYVAVIKFIDKYNEEGGKI